MPPNGLVGLEAASKATREQKGMEAWAEPFAILASTPARQLSRMGRW